MRKTMLFLLTVMLAASLAQAEEWSKTFKLTGKPDLSVTSDDANIHVDTWDKNEIEARVTTAGYKINDGGITVYDHQSGDEVNLEVRFPHHHISIGLNFNNKRVDIEIHMPKEGRVRLHTGDGRIRLTRFKGDMRLESGDGREEIEDVDGVLEATTGDGSIRASGRFDQLNLKTGDGHIDARVLAGSKVNSGWSLRSGDGRLTVQLPENLAADVDLHTSDGHIDIDVPLTVTGRIGTKSLRGKMNGGGGLVTIRTGDGSIHVEKT